ncbi:MAG: hypothetical protein ACXVB0_16805 [Mucilaginibacter sp.]
MAYDKIRVTPAQFLKTIIIIHFALLAGQLLFAVVAFSLAVKVYFGVKDWNDAFMYVGPALAIGGVLAGNFMFRQQLNALAGKNTLSEKISVYQSATIIRFALLEGPSLFSIVAFMLGGNLFFLVISGLLILYMLMLRPAKDRVESDLNLGFDEKMEFLNENEIIK